MKRTAKNNKMQAVKVQTVLEAIEASVSGKLIGAEGKERAMQVQDALSWKGFLRAKGIAADVKLSKEQRASLNSELNTLRAQASADAGITLAHKGEILNVSTFRVRYTGRDAIGLPTGKSVTVTAKSGLTREERFEHARNVRRTMDLILAEA